jgi:hypothetical protein
MEIPEPISWPDAVQAIVSAVAFGVLIYQIFEIARGIRGVTHDSLYGHYNEVCRIFIEKPYLRPYFYENATYQGPDPQHPYLREEIDATSEAICGVIEHAVIQRGNLGDASWSGCWMPYARERLQRSPELRKFFDPNKDWYTHAMRSAMAPLMKSLPAAGAQAAAVG